MSRRSRRSCAATGRRSSATPRRSSPPTGPTTSSRTLSRRRCRAPRRRGGAPPAPWLYTIVRNTALNSIRDAGPATEHLDENFDGVEQPPQALERREELAAVLAGVQALPDPSATALVKREMEGLSHAEIGDAMGVSVAAARPDLPRPPRAARGPRCPAPDAGAEAAPRGLVPRRPPGRAPGGAGGARRWSACSRSGARSVPGWRWIGTPASRRRRHDRRRARGRRQGRAGASADPVTRAPGASPAPEPPSATGPAPGPGTAGLAGVEGTAPGGAAAGVRRPRAEAPARAGAGASRGGTTAAIRRLRRGGHHLGRAGRSVTAAQRSAVAARSDSSGGRRGSGGSGAFGHRRRSGRGSGPAHGSGGEGSSRPGGTERKPSRPLRARLSRGLRASRPQPV